MLVIYLHGFLSAPESTKATLTRHWIAKHRPDIEYLCPRLSSYPSAAKTTLIELLDQVIDQNPVLIGSSLGGYWATWLSEKYDLPAVLINPAVSPSMFLPEYLGVELKNFYSDETYILDHADVQELRLADVSKLRSPKNFWLMVQTADESLDYRLAIKKYAESRQLVENGGNHSFENYQRWLPSVIDFLEQRAAEQSDRE